MELGAVIEPRLLSPASENLVETYLSLGNATPGACVRHEDGFVACIGEFAHPIANFAARLNLDPWSARRLLGLAASRETFNVYRLPGDLPTYLDEVLVRSGFTLTNRLVQMVAGHAKADEFGSMELVGSSGRGAVAQFMADQFFGEHDASFRRALAEATSAAANLELYCTGDRVAAWGRTKAAVMLCEAGGVLGCYNLCVAAQSRGRGIGTAVTRWVVAEGVRRGLEVTLQCDPKLEGWYARHGFRSIGVIEVFNLSKKTSSDILSMV